MCATPLISGLSYSVKAFGKNFTVAATNGSDAIAKVIYRMINP